MIQKATAMSVRQNLGELLNNVKYRHDSVFITKAGKPVAALVDINLFENIRTMKKEFDRLSAELAQSCKDMHEKVVEAEITEALKAIRKVK